ncbi:unnamed protein product [Colletotrichum noveboracense]|uniref:Uncharacterized protein n=1 Tax=Colletotrichum noveboracense TaxID=2664923 RepID=A0A9W4RME7_9PEZI|nr:unnamed protein product [Colletotrichum noveboracense]
MTIGAPVLFSFAFVSFILAVIIEILAQQSQRAGGLALSPSTNEIPTFAKFCYLFLPTIVAVIYSLLWSWIDLDVKRLQPWLEMSRPEGATAEHSIFLDYPYEFVAFVPFKAARRGHWATFYAATVMVIIFWLLTPLQSAILGTRPVRVERAAQVFSYVAPRAAPDQAFILDQSILNEGYAQTWLDQPLPPYTTDDYTLLPFKAESRDTPVSSTNWTGSTTKYWTELECWPAEASRNGPPSKETYDFLNGRGCNASEIDVYGNHDNSQPYKMLYLGYYSSPWSDYWLGMTCSKESAGGQFLATWGHSLNYPDYKINLTSLFCETNYYKQAVNATVSSVDYVPLEDSVVPLGPRERIEEKEFNITAFERLISSGLSVSDVTPALQEKVVRDYPFEHLLEQHQQVADLGVMWPMTPMTGFAIGSHKNVTSLEFFRDEAVLGEAFNSTHKMLFNLALRRVLDNVTVAGLSEGNVDFILHGIIVSRLFSAIVESFLGLVGFFTILLWWHGHRATSRLTMDPASLGSLISLCKNSPMLLDRFAGKGALSEEALKQVFTDQRFKLFCGCQSQSREMVIKVVDVRDESNEEQRISLSQPDPLFPVGHYSPVKPWALRREVGVAVIVVMMGGVAALIYLKLLEQQNKGIIRPNASFEVLQLLENYVPTIIATLLEPFWVLVNRLLCLLQPFRDLWSGKRPAKGSISARYTSLPPQFVFWRASRSGHFILTAMCGLALLSNLLAVGLGGLFNEEPIAIEHPHEFQQSIMPRLNNESVYNFSNPIAPYEIPFLITMNNVTQNTPLTRWVSHEYFFQPFKVIPNDTAPANTYSARTTGFGVNPSCSDMGTFKTRGNTPEVNYTITRNGEAVQGCPSSFTTKVLDLNTTIYKDLTGQASAEYVSIMNKDITDLTICQVPVMFGWSRSAQAANKTGEMETWAVVCDPVFTTAMFDVTVDSDGYVISSSQVSESSPTLDYPLSTNHTDMMITIINSLFTANKNKWHNDTFARDWINYLLKIQPGHADLLDPKSTPDIPSLIPDLEALYRQIYVLALGNTQQNLWETYPEPLTITGIRHVTETRIFMNTTALAISLAVLGINIAVAIALYGLAIKHFLPRMPTTIGSILAYLAPSRAVREYDGPGSLQSATFSFGRYVAEDGRAHVGIELDPFVVPVKLSALRKGDTEPRNGLLRRILGRRKVERGDETWL